MGSQATLWLYPLAIMAIVALSIYIRIGVSWTWGFCLQAGAMLAVSVAGLMSGQPMPFAVAGWLLFLVTIVVPRNLLGRLERQISLLKEDAALDSARTLRWFFWGPPGRFWLDMSEAMALTVRGKPQEGEAIFSRWQAARLPAATREGLLSYMMTARVLRRDWQGIIDTLRSCQEIGKKQVPASIATAAARAYAELGRVPEAFACLELSNLPAIRASETAREQSFVGLFALAGAHAELEELFRSLDRKKQPLPEYSKDYWRGRCLAARGLNGQARLVLQQALAAAPPARSNWRDRISYQLKRLADAPDVVPAPDWSPEVARARAVLERARLVSEITAPKRPCSAVKMISWLIVAVYVLSHGYEAAGLLGALGRGDGAAQTFAAAANALSFNCWRLGTLYGPAVRQGELWRLVTYLFLHAHVSHLALNLFGLWWFGRLAENLFGTPRFLLLYLATGILSGVAQITLSPQMMAVGASGAVMGVFGASAAGIFRCQDLLPAGVRKAELSWMLGLSVAQVILDQIIPNVAAFAHLGGLVAGLLIGLVLPIGKSRLIASVRLAPSRAQ